MVVLALRSLCLAVGVLAVVGCAGHRTPAAVYAKAALDDPRKHPYVIGVADVVRVSVWKDPDLSTDAIVRPDGTITLPLVGEVMASGSTALDLQRHIARRLGEFAKDAVVTVAVAEVNSYHFTVDGNVVHPGVFTLSHYVTVSEAVALAGGPTRYAETSDMVVVRTTSGRTERIRIDYDGILSGDTPEQDIVVLAGDAVRVP